jgi:hypothetical protein
MLSRTCELPSSQVNSFKINPWPVLPVSRLDPHFGLNRASEAFSAALCFHADTLEAALATEPAASRTPTRRIRTVQSPSGQIDDR